jgi:hemolysin activation/secretion protein
MARELLVSSENWYSITYESLVWSWVGANSEIYSGLDRNKSEREIDKDLKSFQNLSRKRVEVRLQPVQNEPIWFRTAGAAWLRIAESNGTPVDPHTSTTWAATARRGRSNRRISDLQCLSSFLLWNPRWGTIWMGSPLYFFFQATHPKGIDFHYLFWITKNMPAV